MKVCAHFSIAPFEQYHERMHSIQDAVAHLKEHGRFDSFSDGERPSVLIDKQCNDCWDHARFHEFGALFELGPRGGIRKTYGP